MYYNEKLLKNQARVLGIALKDEAKFNELREALPKYLRKEENLHRAMVNQDIIIAIIQTVDRQAMQRIESTLTQPLKKAVSTARNAHAMWQKVTELLKLDTTPRRS